MLQQESCVSDNRSKSSTVRMEWYCRTCYEIPALQNPRHLTSGHKVAHLLIGYQDHPAMKPSDLLAILHDQTVKAALSILSIIFVVGN
mgnify:CR=1 FL=1